MLYVFLDRKTEKGFFSVSIAKRQNKKKEGFIAL
jgi:hypothetical protein